MKNKKAKINPKNSDDNCFQYAITVTLNFEQINNHPERVFNISPFINKYNWKDIEFPSNKKDWNEFQKNNKSIALNILYVPHNSEEIRHAYKSKHNLNRENKVILLMITDGKKWHYLAVKSLSALLRRITSTNNGAFCCLNSLHSDRTKDKLKKHENVCKDHDYCYIEMSKENNKILKYNHGKKSMTVPLIISSDLEALPEKMSTCHNNPINSSTAKINKHTASSYSRRV